MLVAYEPGSVEELQLRFGWISRSRRELKVPYAANDSEVQYPPRVLLVVLTHPTYQFDLPESWGQSGENPVESVLLVV